MPGYGGRIAFGAARRAAARTGEIDNRKLKMSEAEIRFERENREGLIPVGTYLSNAAGRFGIRFKEDCVPAEGSHCCEVEIRKGAHLLSEPTVAEHEFFKGRDRGNSRLACHARIEKSGDITIMTTETKTTEEPEEKSEHEKRTEEFRKEFAEMPLEKKIASLVRLEAMALSETVSFVINSPYLVFDKMLDVLAEFGLKKEQTEREAARPQEHSETNATEKPKGRGKGRRASSAEKTE